MYMYVYTYLMYVYANRVVMLSVYFSIGHSGQNSKNNVT